MSYRVDIPTLSANEVYTLTFEYEGEETIQLIVGDLTLETTDRRVVFTTTSPVNYIESNVNLTNLNMYEGYYESDDFGGEYTQESYIEGMSLVNLIQSEKHLDFQNNSCGVETFEDNMIKLTITDVSSLTSTWQHGWIKTSANLKVGATYTCVVHVIENSISTGGITVGASYGTLVHGNASNSLGSGQTGIIVFTYTTATATLKDYNGYYDGFCQVNHVGDWQNGSLKYGIMVFEGDYYDYFINNNIPYFEGIGCVKSPTIKSLSPENLYVSPLKYREPLRGYEYYHNDGTVEIYPNGGGAYSTIDLYTGEDVGMAYLGSQKTWYVNNGIKLGLGAGTYYFCCEIELVANKQITDFTGKPLVGVIYDDAQYFSIINSNFTETYDGEKYYYKGTYGASYQTVTDDIRGIYVGIWSYGISGVEKYVIRNITLTREESLKDMCAISKSSIITTPDDLELYDVYYGGHNIAKQDKLDLTTGILTRNVCKWKLNDYLSSNLNYWNFREWSKNGETTNEYVKIELGAIGNPYGRPTLARGWSEVYGLYFNYWDTDYGASYFYDGVTYFYVTSGGVVFMCSKAQILSWTGVESYESLTKQHIYDWFVAGDFTMMNVLSEPTTEQLSLNPLKSYYNGSIQTSSQQLTPTLITTLPISNKFTTTNLTSGSTYNVYFDGTATKLDAGGTIITNPVSPCEVECGGTTLTIEGTDIQNVRVLETSVENEVGSVCGTTDVELSKVKTYKYENILDDIKYNTTVWNGAVINIDYDDFCIEFMGNHGWAGEFADTGLKYPTGCSLVHVEFDIDMDNPNLRMAINFNEGINNQYPQHRHVTLNNDTATIAQGNYDNIYTSIITKGHFSRLMYANGDRPIIINLYTGSYITGNLATGNSAEGSIDGYETIGSNYGRITNLKMRIIENFSSNYTTVTSVLRDSSYNIIWQDMNMSMPQTISKLEQPIKLRSLGTTYDSYNPVTGELTKRIGVSETDGSYSVLSSPIVISSNYKILQDNNIILDSFPQEMNSAYVDFLPTQLLPNTTYTVFLDATTAVGQLECGLIYNGDWYDGMKNFTVGVQSFVYTTDNQIDRFGGFRIRGWGSIINNLIMVQGEYSLDYYNPIIPPQLYTNGQVKVYSDSDVYPTTILNGQSTNNYEINELNTSNNYTIRYEGECESINLANKSNTQGTNRIVKSGSTSGNLTFVNDSGDIDNVLLVQNDVREQEINHFNGLETVEVSGMLIETSQNMWWNDWIEPSQYDSSWLVDSADYIQVNGGETIYIVANSNTYYSIVEFDENYTKINFSNTLMGNPQQQPVVKNGYYKNFLKLRDNTKYIKFVAPKGSAQNQTSNPTFTFSRVELNEPILSANIPYQSVIIDLPQPVQLNSLPDGTCDTYNPITGEYVQNVGYFVLDDTFASCWRVLGSNNHSMSFAQRDLGTQEPHYLTLTRDYGFPTGSLYDYNQGTKAIANVPIVYQMDSNTNVPIPSIYCDTYYGNHYMRIKLPFIPTDLNQWNYSYTQVNDWLRENPIHIVYKRTEPITTQLTPIEIPTFEGGIVQLITTDGKVFPMVEYSMPTNNRYDTSSWETGVVYTQRNMTEAYFNESTTPMTPTETMTLTTDHISSGSIILNDNGNGLIVLKGNYTGRDIPYFTGMRSVEAIEIETTPSPDQPLFGKGGRK